MDMFENYERLITSQTARITRLEKALDEAKAEREAARNALAQMKASVPPATSKR